MTVFPRLLALSLLSGGGWADPSRPPPGLPSGQLERKKQHSWLLRASRRAKRFVVVITSFPFRHASRCGMSKGRRLGTTRDPGPDKPKKIQPRRSRHLHRTQVQVRNTKENL